MVEAILEKLHANPKKFRTADFPHVCLIGLVKHFLSFHGGIGMRVVVIDSDNRL